MSFGVERSAHVDTFTRDNLPPLDQWPDMNFAYLGFPPRLNASVTLIEDAIALVGKEKIAIIGPEGAFSYGAFEAHVSRVANLLEADGVLPGNRVLLRGPNNISVAALWFAVLRVGAVVVTTIHLQRSGELEKIVELGKIQFALVDHRFLEEWDDVSNFVGKTWAYGSGGKDDFLVRSRLMADTHVPCDTSADDVSMLAFTSGSTGVPKATMHFHRDILAIADTFSRDILKPTSSDVFAGTPPLAFTFGLGGLLIFPFRAGATAVLLEIASPSVLLEKIVEHGISCLFTSPTAYRAMLSQMTNEVASQLRRCVSAGEHLPKATWQAWFAATGNKLIDGIGATEMLHIFISAADDEIIAGMTGKPIPGFEAMVVDGDFNRTPLGAPGRLAVKGPTGCRYLNDDRQLEYVTNGWNLTGDVFIEHENGYFEYQARGDDMIISSGYNIAAPEVENALLSHPCVAEVAVVATPDEERGSVVTAHVVLASTHLASDELRLELQNHVKNVISPYKYPRLLHFVEALPKTTTGKLQRFRLK